MDRLEGRNPVVECLARGRRKVHRIWLDQGARPDERVSRILTLAAERGVKVDRVDRARLDRMAEGRVHNGVVAEVDPIADWTTESLLESLFAAQVDPFLVLADGLQYEHNLGAVLRSALGFGVSGVVLPTRRGAPLSPIVQRVAMGAVEEVPIVRESLFVALGHLGRAAVPVVGADMGGVPLGSADLRGPIAIVLGEEGRGLSPKLREKCDHIVSVPVAGGLESLNVSVAAGILFYEKRRQEGWSPELATPLPPQV
jgi:23S rRNA (guanosine2251-2'-O)-methyltransferase